MTELLRGTASVEIARSAAEVFAVVTDLERMGEWSPESGAIRWLDGATAAGAGVRFAGDNEIRLGPIPVKRWTTESVVTAFEPPHVFEFESAGATTWRFELAERDGTTTLSESFAFEGPTGLKRIMYNALGARDQQMLAGVERTLAAIKAHLEAS